MLVTVCCVQLNFPSKAKFQDSFGGSHSSGLSSTSRPIVPSVSTECSRICGQQSPWTLCKQAEGRKRPLGVLVPSECIMFNTLDLLAREQGEKG